MNRKITGRLGAVALILTLISMSFAGGTLAKYTADVTGKATATVAKFAFDLNGATEQSASRTINLSDLFKNTYGAGSEVSAAAAVVAPGTSGSAKITLSNKGEVAIQPTFTVTQTNAGNVPLEYAVTTAAAAPAADSAEWKADLNISQAAVGAGASDEVFYLHWRWKFSEDSGDNYTDTNLGTKTTLDTVKLDITCTVSQVAPTTAAP